MKDVFRILFVAQIFFLPYICFSQSVAESDSSKTEYKHAIQFYILNDIVVAYKYHFSEASALRITADFSGSYNNKDSEKSEYWDEDADTLISYMKSNYIHSDDYFELKVEYLYQIKLHDPVDLFVGCGGFVNYDFRLSDGSSYHYTPESILDGSGYNRWTSTMWKTGITLSLGIEAALYKNIAVFSEYQAQIYKGWEETGNSGSSGGGKTSRNNYTDWGYELRSIRIGVGIYF